MEKQNKQVNAIKYKGKKFSPAFQRWRSHPVAARKQRDLFADG